YSSSLTPKFLPRTLDVSEWNLREDLQTVSFQCNQLARMIAQDSHRMNVERGENLRADTVFPLLASEGNRFVGIDARLPMGLDLALVFAHFSSHNTKASELL